MTIVDGINLLIALIVAAGTLWAHWRISKQNKRKLRVNVKYINNEEGVFFNVKITNIGIRPITISEIMLERSKKMRFELLLSSPVVMLKEGEPHIAKYKLTKTLKRWTKKAKSIYVIDSLNKKHKVKGKELHSLQKGDRYFVRGRIESIELNKNNSHKIPQ
ncbi:MAG: hypothetical protein ACTSPP_10075 [Candidatus Heimdallarchaeaceae archaeon]